MQGFQLSRSATICPPNVHVTPKRVVENTPTTCKNILNAGEFKSRYSPGMDCTIRGDELASIISGFCTLGINPG
jgi:hypothetical protein